MTDDLRLTVSLQEEQEALSVLEGLRELELEGEGELRERVIVSHEGPRVFLYADTEERIEQARELVDDVLRELGLGAIVTLTRWHPIEQRWEDSRLPLPRTPEEREAERRIRLERETTESFESGYAEWEVRIELPSHEQTVLLAERLESEGIPVVRRFTYVLVGAANEDEARALADRLREEAPAGARVLVEPGGQMVWEVAPRNPFVVFGGLGI
jgi:hypothetical protein